MALSFLLYKFLKNRLFKNKTIITIVLTIPYFIFFIFLSGFITIYSVEIIGDLEDHMRFNTKINNQRYYNFFKEKGLNIEEIQQELEEELTILHLNDTSNYQRAEAIVFESLSNKYKDFNIAFHSTYIYHGDSTIKMQVEMYSTDYTNKHINIPVIINKKSPNEEIISKARGCKEYSKIRDLFLNRNTCPQVVEKIPDSSKEKVELQSSPFKIYAIYDNELSLTNPIYFEIENTNIVTVNNSGTLEENLKNLSMEAYKNRYNTFDKVEAIEILSTHKQENIIIVEARVWWYSNGNMLLCSPSETPKPKGKGFLSI